MQHYVHADDTHLCEAHVTYTRKDGSLVTVPAVSVFHTRSDGLIHSSRIYVALAPLYAWLAQSSSLEARPALPPAPPAELVELGCRVDLFQIEAGRLAGGGCVEEAGLGGHATSSVAEPDVAIWSTSGSVDPSQRDAVEQCVHPRQRALAGVSSDMGGGTGGRRSRSRVPGSGRPSAAAALPDGSRSLGTARGRRRGRPSTHLRRRRVGGGAGPRRARASFAAFQSGRLPDDVYQSCAVAVPRPGAQSRRSVPPSVATRSFQPRQAAAVGWRRPGRCPRWRGQGDGRSSGLTAVILTCASSAPGGRRTAWRRRRGDRRASVARSRCGSSLRPGGRVPWRA